MGYGGGGERGEPVNAGRGRGKRHEVGTSLKAMLTSRFNKDQHRIQTPHTWRYALAALSQAWVIDAIDDESI